jgi:CYTH domain-containing protein
MESRYEIERRYLVRVTPGLWARLGDGHAYRQGYVKNGTPSVRIRLGEPRGPVLTLKSGKGVKRREIETVVPLEIAEGLMQAAGKRVIEKTRWGIGPWQLDRFEGPLEGLTLLEIELDAVDDPIPHPPDGVAILGEVTDDKRFTNGYLARLKKKEQKGLVRHVYREWGE